MGIHSAALLDKKFLEMLKLLNIYLNHFPRHEKYALCTRIRNTAYGLYDLIPVLPHFAAQARRGCAS